MVQKRVALPAVGLGLLAAGGLAGRAIVRSWRNNPDPLGGQPVRFPDGEQRTVQLPDGADITTVSVGDGPTIVLVHGLTASKHDWGPIAPTLVAAGYRVLAVDQRGHGESTPGNAGYGSTQLAADLAHVLDELDVHAAALVGHSMGGMTAMAYAVHHPAAFNARVERLVLIATAASLETARHQLGLSLGGVHIPEGIVPADDRLRVGAGLGVFGRSPSLHMVDEVIDMFRACPEPVRAAATVALKDHDVVDQLPSIAAPTLVIGADRDQLIRPHQVRELADGIPDAALELFPDAGHMVHWEERDAVSQLILNHLAREVPGT